MSARSPLISASVLNADFARLGDEVERAVAGGVDSIHLDVMDGHFVRNITMGPVVVEAVRPFTTVPYHSHLMISRPLEYARAFADAGSDVVIFHLEADDDPGEVIAAIRGRRPAARPGPQPRDARRGRAPVPRPDRHAAGHDGQPRLGRPGVHGRGAAQAACAARRSRAARPGPAHWRGWRREPGQHRRGPCRRRRRAGRRQGAVCEPG